MEANQKELRKLIKNTLVKSLLNEGLQEKLSFLLGKQINLIKTLHTTGKWNEEKREMDKVTSSEEVSGIIGTIGDYGGHEVPGFWLMNGDNKKMGFVMYDKKSDKFIEGDSMYHYEYVGQTDKDNRVLQLIKDNLS